MQLQKQLEGRERERDRERELAMSKPHAVIVPHPTQGHMNPMLKLAKLLYRKGFYITFVNSESSHKRLLKARGPRALDGLPDFKFGFIAEGIPAAEDGRVQDPYVHVDAMLREAPLPFFREFVDDLRSLREVPPISCFICDGITTFPLKVAREIGVPCALFWTPSACGVLGYAYYRKLIGRGLLPLKDERHVTNGYVNTVVDIPSMEGIRLWDLPHFDRTIDTEHLFLKYFLTEIEKAYNCSAIILNTIDALEHGVLDTLRKLFPPIYAIGPLNLLEKKQIPESSVLDSIGLNLWKEDLDCLAWLDKKEPNSVIYVNFGSIVQMPSQELVEFGWGLANSKQHFLWAIRPDLVFGESAVFPPEFEAEIKERGLLLSWTPQEKILQHPSVGGFLTHCGWNSILESIVEGVPMICWPAFAEQYTNCWFLCKHWGLGMELTKVEREEVERLVRELMVGEKGKKVKAKAMEWKKVVEDAVTAPAGSSHVNLNNLINEVLLSKFQT